MTGSSAVTGKGPSIGSYLDRDIPAWIISSDRTYEFNRLWDEKRGDLAQLADDEVVISPGLVYSLAEQKP